MDVTPNRSQHQIKNGDILLSYIGMLCMGKPQFQAVHEMDDDRDFYKSALGIAYNIPSEETLRQRMDDIGSSQREHILAENVELLRSNGIVPSKLPNGFVPVMSHHLTIRKPEKKAYHVLIKGMMDMLQSWLISERKGI